jgi:hypothetical protein
MSNLIDLVELAKQENIENYLNSIHNFFCETEKIIPYNNKCFIDFVSELIKEINND